MAKAAARRALPKGTLLWAADSYTMTMQTLRDNGAMTHAQYAAATGSIARMSDRELRHWEDSAWNDLGPGKILSELHHFYNVKTGH